MISTVFKPTDKIKFVLEKTQEQESTVSLGVSNRKEFSKKNSGFSSHSTNASHRSNSVEETRYQNEAFLNTVEA